MEVTIALILLGVFTLLMILMHKFGGLCTSPAAPAATVAEAKETPCKRRVENDSYFPMTPEDTPRMDSTNLPRECASPRSDYAISITDSTVEDLDMPDVPVVTRSTRVISFLRFSGYSQSDVSLSDRSTSQSLWSSFSYTTGSECHEVAEVEEARATPKFFTKSRTQHDVTEDVDTVEIGELDGFKQRNLLSFKPQKPRALTTKHIKKHKDVQLAPTHAYSL